MSKLKALLKFFYEGLLKGTFWKFVINSFVVGIVFAVLDAIFGNEPAETVEILVAAFALTWALHVDEENKVNATVIDECQREVGNANTDNQTP